MRKRNHLQPTLPTVSRSLAWLLIQILFTLNASLTPEQHPPPASIVAVPCHGNLKARRLFDCVLCRFPNETQQGHVGYSQWKKLRNYLYSAETLSVGQVDSVCGYLATVLDQETLRHVLQTNPRICRKTVATNLEPTVSFLRELYGDQLMKHAIRRNPKLLLTRGTGYDSPTLDLVPVYFRRDLNFSDAALSRLKKSAPFVFRLHLSRVMENSMFLLHLLLASMPELSAQPTLRKMIARYPNLLQLSHEKLSRSVLLIQTAANLTFSDVSRIVRKNPTVLGHSDGNLKSTLGFLRTLLEPGDLRKCLMKHPALLSLSLSNLMSKVMYWESLDRPGKSRRDSLAARVLRRAPAAYSLSLESIQPKVDILMKVSGVEKAGSCSSVASWLSENPSILTLSLEGNLKPTILFLNRSGYIELDSTWNVSPNQPRQCLRPRYLSASLYQRMVPRWLFGKERSPRRIPLYILAAAPDPVFCDFCQCDLAEFQEFLRRSLPLLKLSTQFEVWLLAGRSLSV